MKIVSGLLAVWLGAAGIAAAAQVNEGFESGLPTTAPATATDYTLGSGVWSIQRGLRTTTRHGGAYGLSLTNGSTTAAFAVTPAFSGVSSITLWARGSGASSLRLQKAVAGGAYTDVATQAITSSFASYTIAVNEAGSVRLRLQNTTSQTHYIDDVVITTGGTSTPTPTGSTPTPTTRPTATPTTRPTTTPTTRPTTTPTTRPTATPTTRVTPTPTTRPTPTATMRPTATPTVTPTPPNSASILYVGPNGTDGAPGTIDNPTTLHSAVNRVLPGGTIYMRGGTYEYATTVMISRGNDGTASARKSIIAYQSEKPILDFGAQAFDPANRGIEIRGHYWYLKGLEVSYAGDNGVYVAGNNNIVERCLFHHNRDSGLQISRWDGSAPFADWPANNLILNCDSHDNYDTDNGEDADGFACKLTSGPGNVFRGCIAWRNSDDGWDLFTKTATGPIGTVLIEDCVAYENGILSDGTSPSSGDGNGYKLGGEQIAVNHTIRRSVAFKNRVKGFHYNSNSGSITVTNNTGWNNGGGNFRFDRGTHILTNNVSYVAATSDALSGTDVEFTNCLWHRTNGSLNGKGLFVDASDFLSLTPFISRNADGSPNLGNFLKLAPGSDLVNAGTPSGTDIGYIESH